MRIAHPLPLGVACVALYAVLAWGAAIYGSYRHEPSGVQYSFLPAIAAPACLLLAIWIAFEVRGGGRPRLLVLLPFAAVVILALPVLGLPLADRTLEAARWATISVGVGHAVALLAFVTRLLRVGSDVPQA